MSEQKPTSKPINPKLLVAMYAASGAGFGASLTIGAWIFVMLDAGLDLSLANVAAAHRLNQLLYLIDGAAVVGGAIFAKIGQIQARLHRSNLQLEDRVRERTFEITMEKARTTAIFDSAADGIITFSEQGSVLHYNNAAARLFGYSSREATGRQIAVLIPGINLGGLGSSGEIPIGMPRELHGLRKDGTEFPIELDLSRFSIGDEISFTAIARDISERRRQSMVERALQQVIDEVNRTDDLVSLYQSIHESLSNVMDATNFYIALVSDDRKTYHIAHSVDEKYQISEGPRKLERSVVGLVVESGKPVLINAAEYLAMRKAGLVEGSAQASVSWLGVPLASGGSVLGVMAVQSHTEGVLYTQKDVSTMMFVSSQIAHAIERERARESLRTSERRYRRMVEEAGDIVYQTNRRGYLTYANPPITTLTGYREDELLGKHSSVLVPEEWKRRTQDFYRSQLDSRARDTTYEFPIIRKDGAERWIEQNVTLLTEGDEIVGFQAIVHDITERRHSQQITDVLYSISEITQNSTDLDEFYSRLRTALHSIIDTGNFYVALYHRDRGTISFPFAVEGEKALEISERPIGMGLTGYVLRTGKTLLADEKALEELYKSGAVAPIGKPARQWLGVPLMNKDVVIGAVVIQSYTDATHYKQVDVQTMSFVSSQIAVAIERKQREEEVRRSTRELAEAHARIKEDLRLAARVQQARLPKDAPDVRGYEFDWLFDSCDEVAGDMFNFVRLDEDRLGIYILDVSGHGVPAALLSMTLSRALMPTSDGTGVLFNVGPKGIEVANPAEVAERMNERFPMSLETNQYFTFLYGILNVRKGSFTFVRGGHPAPILVGPDGARELDEECGPAIGILPVAHFEETTIQLRPGDKVVLFTDGVDEATAANAEEFGMKRTLETLAGMRDEGVGEGIRGLRRMIREFTAGAAQSDDITIVAFGRTK